MASWHGAEEWGKGRCPLAIEPKRPAQAPDLCAPFVNIHEAPWTLGHAQNQLASLLTHRVLELDFNAPAAL